MIDIWRHAFNEINEGRNPVLVMVVDHTGSVPGTTGAAMVVSDTDVVGTVGGGSVEHEMITTARGFTRRSDLIDVEHTREASGSLCSGSHTLAMILLEKSDEKVIKTIIDTLSTHGFGALRISESAIEFHTGQTGPTTFETGTDGWDFSMTLGLLDTLTIVGGGHCSLALSRIMATLPFRVVVLDHRPNLPTMEANTYAHELKVVDFEDLASHVPGGDRSWAVIMTFGHTHDEVALRALEGTQLRYLGLMGSEAKVRQMFGRMRSDGVPQGFLDSVSAPVGISIGSHTPEEIAVSIAAEMIRLKNQ